MKNFIKKLLLLSALLSVFMLCIPKTVFSGGLPEDDSWKEWTVEESDVRVLYRTHGKVVWGHDFGFYKTPNNCNYDILWLTLSSMDERVKNFKGKDVKVSLIIDGTPHMIEPTMTNVGVVGSTQVMLFTNWLAGPVLIDALTEGEYVKVRIFAPEELEGLMDIKEDTFSLRDFDSSRQKAKEMCKELKVNKG